MPNKTNVLTQSVQNFVDKNYQKPGAKHPLRFWEVDNFFKCPVVGICLTVSDQKHLLKKAGLSYKKKSPYEIHELFVACSENKNRLSKRVDNFLDHKYGAAAKLLLELDHAQLLAHIKTCIASGEYVIAVWAAAIYPGLPLAVKRKIFGEIHMTMHWSGEQGARIKQKLVTYDKKINRLEKNLKNAMHTRRTLQKEKGHLSQVCKTLEATLSGMETEKDRHDKNNPSCPYASGANELEQENERLKAGIEEMRVLVKDYQNQVAQLKQTNQQLSETLDRQKALNLHYQEEIQAVISEFSTLNRCDASCPSFDLCKKRVLIVGGITRMESLYRELIEGSGGIFEYHDGYMNKGVRQLESRLRRADVVVCPVSCNSHAACSIVKNLAKKHKKTVHMVAGSSLTAVSQVIQGNDKARAVN